MRTRLQDPNVTKCDIAIALMTQVRDDIASQTPLPPGDLIVVHPGDDLTAILAAAPDGATVQIDPAYVGDLGDWTLAKPVTLCSPDTGHGRITPSADLPMLQGFLTITAAHVTLRALYLVGPQPAGTLVTTGPQTTLDRCVLMGSSQGQHRGVLVESADVIIRGCHVANIWKDQDTQAIGGSNGTRHLLVQDCYLEASGENVMFGGSDAVDEAHQPQDITIEDCHLYKPLAWRGQAGCTVKNLFELKNARRVTLRRCVLENCWQHGQDGYAIVLSVRNQDGGNPWACVSDVLIEDCTTSNTGAGVQLLGRDDSNLSGIMTNVTLRRVAFTEIDPWTMGGSGRSVLVNRGPKNVHFEHCTWSGAHLNSALYFAVPECPCDGFAYTDCTAQEGDYGIFGEGEDTPLGVGTLDRYCPGYVWDRNTIIDDNPDRTIPYPPGTTVRHP